MSSPGSIFSCLFSPAFSHSNVVFSQGHFYGITVIYTFLQSVDLIHQKFGSSFCPYSICKWLLSSGEEATEDIFAIEHKERTLALQKLASTFFYAFSRTVA